MENGLAQKTAAAVPQVRDWQEQLIRGSLLSIVIVGPLAAAMGSYYDYTRGIVWTIPVYWLVYALVVFVTFRRRVSYSVRVLAFMALIYAVAALDIAGDGRSGIGRQVLLLLPMVAVILLGLRAGILAVVLMVVTMLAGAWAFTSGRLVAPILDSSEPLGWISTTLVMLMLGAFIVVALNHLVPRLVRALDHSRSLALELEQERARLEAEVTKRTAELERRSAQLATAAEVARDAAQFQDLDALLDEAVRLVSQRFGFYHTAIFMLDEGGQYAVLRAASSEGGRVMLARRHRLALGVGLVGSVATGGRQRLALDVGQDAVYFDNPDLPQTRSEVALPLRARGQIIGVLDVQSDRPAAFGPEDVVVLQTLADQVAVAINNADLFRQAQESLAAERRAYGQLSLEAWQEVIRAQPHLRQRYDPHGFLAQQQGLDPEARKSIQHGHAVQRAAGEAQGLSVPVRIREQVIGVLDAYKPSAEGGWTRAEVDIMSTLADQLGIALDSARLYQDTQRLAARERLIAQVTGRMRQTLDLDTVLQTAAREMQAVLDLAEVELWLEDSGSDLAEGRA